MFNVDFRAMVRPLIPWFIRTDGMKAWLYALIAPLETLHLSFRAWYTEVLYELNITGQIIYQEKLLNDKFNGGLPAYTSGVPSGIYITDADDNKPTRYMWNRMESRPVIYLYNNSEAQPTYMYNTTDYNYNVKFVVHVPYSVGDVTDPIFSSKIKAWIEKYRIAGALYRVVNY